MIEELVEAAIILVIAVGFGWVLAETVQLIEDFFGWW